MKLLTRDTDYAIRAVCYIARNKQRTVPAVELAKALKIPRPFLRKILQSLNKESMLKSCKGLGGGFRLNKAAEKIFLPDFISAFQGPFTLCDHTLKHGPCHDIRKCALKKRLDSIERYIKSQLKNITIADLIR